MPATRDNQNPRFRRMQIRHVRAVQEADNGARVVWAVVRDGTLEERTRGALELLLGSSGGEAGGQVA